MTIIKATHEAAPNFPATNYHPQCERHPIDIGGMKYADCIGGAPTQAEIEVFLRLDPESIAASLAEEARKAALRADAMRQQLIAQLEVATPAQISNYVDANVTNLAEARALFKRILLVMSGMV